MSIQSSKIIALITGFISILICVSYLLFIAIFDFRSFLNDRISIDQDNLAVIFLSIENFL